MATLTCRRCKYSEDDPYTLISRSTVCVPCREESKRDAEIVDRWLNADVSDTAIYPAVSNDIDEAREYLGIEEDDREPEPADLYDTPARQSEAA